MNRYLLIFLLMLPAMAVYAQQQSEKSKKVQVISLDKLSYKKIDGRRARVLVGNVAFKKDSVIFYCDSAIQYTDDESIYAYENVRFNRGDTLKLTGDELFYSEKEKLSIITGEQVFMTDNTMKLITIRLFYNMADDIAYYTDSAYITDRDNILHSIKGYYYSRSKNMHFKKRVVLRNSNYEVFTDTLIYNVQSENSTFLGPSKIYTNEGEYLYCENGKFFTAKNEVYLGKNSLLEKDAQTLRGDSIYYNSKKGEGIAFKRVSILDTTQQIAVDGNYATFAREKNRLMVTDSVLFKQFQEDDTTRLSADTLRMCDDSLNKRVLKAYYGVKIYGNSYQAVCDSLCYRVDDSMMYYRGSPIFWMDNFQVNSVTIDMRMQEGGIDKVYLRESARLGQSHGFRRYDQIKSDSMIGHFRNGNMRLLDAYHNSEAIYYVLEEDSALVGVNKISSKHAKIYFTNQQVSKLNFIEQTKSNVIPAPDVNPIALKLSGFKWYGHLRPKSEADLFKLRQKDKALQKQVLEVDDGNEEEKETLPEE